MKNLFLFTILALGLLWKPQTAAACSCAYDPNLTEEERIKENFDREYNEIIFVGEVKSEDDLIQRDTGYESQSDVEIIFTVDTLYKGDAPEKLSVFTSSQGSACGISFKKNTPYLVFVGDFYKDGTMNTGLCSGNVQNPSPELLAVLGSGYAPDDADIPSETNDPVVSDQWLLPTVGAGLVILGVAFSLQRKQLKFNGAEK